MLGRLIAIDEDATGAGADQDSDSDPEFYDENADNSDYDTA